MGFLNKLLETRVLPPADNLLGTNFIASLKEVRQNDTLSEEELQSIQLRRLAEMLTFVTKNSPYYRELTTIKNLSNPIEWLKTFPILNKKIIKENTSKILTADPKGLIKHFSSGSSGEQGCVYLSNEEESYIRAQQVRWWEWANYSIGSKLLQTGMATKRSWFKWTKDWLFRTHYIYAFALPKAEIKAVLLQVKRKKIKFFFGYASSLFVFAEVAEEYNLQISFDSVLSWGDKMFDHYRKKIEEVFNTKVYETYGCTEGFMIASQKDTRFLYIMNTAVYLELLDEKGNEVPDGEIGNVVVTSLIGKSFPLIRYKLGDLAVKLPRHMYPNKRAFSYPILQKVIGRDTDIVKTPSGRSLIVHSFTGIFEYYPQVRQFRVIQHNLTGVLIEVIPTAQYSDELEFKLKDRIASLIQEPFEIVFKRVENIPASPSGKPQIIKSLLPRTSNL